MNCQYCGNLIKDDATKCPFCGQPVDPNSPAVKAQLAASEAKSGNMLLGTIGAIVGASIGGAVIILFSQMGLVASISGLILAVCTLKGYQLLGRRVNTTGLIICLALIAITPYLADRLDWAIMLKENFGTTITLWEAFVMVPDFIAIDPELKAEYIKCLGMVYGFAAMGAFGTLRDLFRG